VARGRQGRQKHYHGKICRFNATLILALRESLHPESGHFYVIGHASIMGVPYGGNTLSSECYLNLQKKSEESMSQSHSTSLATASHGRSRSRNIDFPSTKPRSTPLSAAAGGIPIVLQWSFATHLRCKVLHVSERTLFARRRSLAAGAAPVGELRPLAGAEAAGVAGAELKGMSRVVSPRVIRARRLGPSTRT